MCSIVGAKNEHLVKKMLSTMKHRAPDDEDIFVSSDFCLGMGRLSIIDLKSKGLCPYIEDDLVLTFNGEIYNYKELRKELEEKGYIFRTESDTEVLLKSYKEWGYACLDKFNGMFAFCIKDGKTLFLARDIAGEKPLYFSYGPFRFASEAKALDWKCMELRPATYMLYDLETETAKFERWWWFEPVNIKDPVATLELLLEDSIRLRTQADVPYGLYLSNGIDSSLINTFHNFEHTFTYEDGDYKEEFDSLFEKIVWHLDYPTTSFSPFGLWKLAEQASKKVKVVLSGEGADELFGGYIRYMPDALYEQARNIFPSYWKMFPVKQNLNYWCWKEFHGNLRQLLRMGDRMSSAFGIENRCPFLDRRIIEFAFSIPPELKIRGFDT